MSGTQGPERSGDQEPIAADHRSDIAPELDAPEVLAARVEYLEDQLKSLSQEVGGVKKQLSEANEHLDEANGKLDQLLNATPRTGVHQTSRTIHPDVAERSGLLEAGGSGIPPTRVRTPRIPAPEDGPRRGTRSEGFLRRHRGVVGFLAGIAIAAGGAALIVSGNGHKQNHAPTPIAIAHKDKKHQSKAAPGDTSVGATALTDTEQQATNRIFDTLSGKSATIRNEGVAAQLANAGNQNLGASVAGAVEQLHNPSETSAQFREFVIHSYTDLGQYNHLSVSHSGDRESSQPELNKHSSTVDVLTASWLSSVNSHSYRASVWNSMHNRPVDAPIEGVSPQRQLHDIYKYMTNPDLNVDGHFMLDGEYANGAIAQADGHIYSEPTDFNGVRAVKLVDANGQTVIIKVGGGSDGNKTVCINIQEQEVEQPAPVTPNTPVTPVTPHHPGHPAPKKKHHRHHPGHPGHPGKPGKPGQPSHPGTPVQQPPQVWQIKSATSPAGPQNADRSGGTVGPQEPTVPVAGPGPDATPIVATTTPAASATYPETGGTPASGEPDAPVVTGTSNGAPVASTPEQGESTQPTSGGGVAGQGGSVNANTPASSNTNVAAVTAS